MTLKVTVQLAFPTMLIFTRTPLFVYRCLRFLFSRLPPIVNRHISAAPTRRDLLPGSDRRPLHAGRAGPDGLAVKVQQCRRVPGGQQGDQPQVAGANIGHWCFAAFPVHT